MLIRGTLLAALIACAAPAFAQDRYLLDPAHTQVSFSIDRFGFNNVLGQFDSTTGVVVLDAANPENSTVTAEVQMASVSAGDATRDEHLRGDRWLHAAAHPTMRYRSTAVTRTGETTATVVGELTLMGQTHPLTLNVTLNKLGESPSNRRQAAGFSAEGALSRAQWGIAIAPGLIEDEVVIRIEALGYREEPTP